MTPAVAGTLVLAWRPLLDPLPLDGAVWWLTVVPLALGLAVAYKGVRTPRLSRGWQGYPRAVGLMTLQIILLVLGLALALHLLVDVAGPTLWG